MEPLPAALTAAALSALGRWARGSSVTLRTVVGISALLAGLTAVQAFDASLAKSLGLLVVTGVAFAHAPAIMERAQL